VCAERQAGVAELAGNPIALDDDLGDRPRVDGVQEVRIRNFVAAAALGRVLEEVEERDQQQADNDPDSEIPEMRIHRCPFWRRLAGATAARRPDCAAPTSPDALEIGTHRMLAKLLPSNPQNADTHPSEFKFLS